MNASSRDWARLGSALRMRRNRLGMKQAEVAQAAGVTPRTVLNYEKGRAPKDDEEVPGAYYRIEQVIGWAPGSVDDVLAGGEPTLQATEDSPDDLDLAGITAEALALYPHVISFGRLCVTAGGNAQERAAFDEAATRLLHSVPAYAALGAKGLQRADLELASLRSHAEGDPVPLDDVLRAIQAAADGESDERR